ncbi:MAG: ABC transporter ATP-binding protein [Actinobacteria bacterium]|nr:ABC transporter ATP-binding protein [Actinomycetota bacterium]
MEEALMDGSRLRLHGVSKRFGDVAAIDDFELVLGAGEMVALLGPSGCGKTTALRIAAGLERPDAGSVVIDGIDVTALPPDRRGLGMVFQDYSLFPHLTVVDNVGFGLRVRGVSLRASREESREALALLRIPELADRYPHQISGGQRQRVALARAIAIRPRVLLLDEPLSALDAKVRMELRAEIRSLQLQQGFSALFVTHDQEEALSISDRVIVMRDGRVEQVGSPREVYANPATPFVASFIGQTNSVPTVVIASMRCFRRPPLRPTFGKSTKRILRTRHLRNSFPRHSRSNCSA